MIEVILLLLVLSAVAPAAYISYQSFARRRHWSKAAHQLELECQHGWTPASMTLTGTYRERETKVWERMSDGAGRNKRHHTVIRVALHHELWKGLDLQTPHSPDAIVDAPGDISKSFFSPDISDLVQHFEIGSTSRDQAIDLLNTPRARDVLSQLDNAYHHISLCDGYLTVDSLHTIDNTVWLVEWIRDIHDDVVALEDAVARESICENEPATSSVEIEEEPTDEVAEPTQARSW